MRTGKQGDAGQPRPLGRANPCRSRLEWVALSATVGEELWEEGRFFSTFFRIFLGKGLHFLQFRF